mgnify:FL=1
MSKNDSINKDIKLEIEKACNQLKELLEEQYKRAVRIDSPGKSRDKNNEAIVIGIAYGDGIGPIITSEAERLLKVILAGELERGEVKLKKIEGLTIENRMEKGEAVPKDVLEEIKTCDVFLKGPTTTPKGDGLESANVALRRELDLYANVRPIKDEGKKIDWTFFRENTEGEYVLGSKGCLINGEDASLAVDFKITTESGTRRIAKAAMDFARKTGKRKIAIVTKANIMKKTDGMFSRVCHEVGADYPELELKDWYIDIMAANLINRSIRSDFEVFILPNLYGDIITDEAAQIQGGVGTAGSANIGSEYAMFEAVHGSAPFLIEMGIAEYANPTSIFTAVCMMLKHIGYTEKANHLRSALEKAIRVKPDEIKASVFTDIVLENM